MAHQPGFDDPAESRAQSHVPPRYQTLELFCPNIACGDPMPIARIAAGPPYGAPVAFVGDEVPRLRRRLIFLGANFWSTQFVYMCPVCAHRRLFQRNLWTGMIDERAVPPGVPQGGPGGGVPGGGGATGGGEP